MGFSGKLMPADCVEAEAWRLLKGLELCWNTGARAIVAEFDAKVLVEMFTGSQPRRAVKEPWADIWNYLQQD